MAHYGASNGWLGTLCVLFTASAALSFAAPSASAPKGDLAKADRYYVEKSYRLAREIYDAFLADPASAKSPRFREIQFKAADCFAKEDPQANREEALKRLEDLTSKAPYDQWWARANQSRAELLQQVDPWGGMDKIQESLLAAIGFWGHSTDVERGLPLYLELNFKLGEMINQRWSWQVCEGAFQVVDEPPYVRRRPGPPVPPEKQNFDADLARWAFQNIIQRAADKEDKARALFLLAQRDNQIWRPLKDKNAAERAKKEARESLLTIINDLGQTKAAPDALLLMAQILNEAQDYVGALERLEQLTAQFRRGEAAAYDQAQQMIREIANPQCSIQCGQSFPPGSYIQANLQYRNIDAVAYELWRVDPAAVVKNAPNLKDRFGDWGSMIAAAPGAEKMRSWNDDKIVADKKHIPHSQPTYLDPLGPGLYVLKASPAPAVQKRRDEDIESQLRAVFLVSDLALTVKTGKTDLYAFVTNAITGVPVPEAKVTVIHKWSQQMPRPLKLLGEQWIDNAEVIEGLTEGNGLAKVALPPATHEQGKTRNHQYLVAAVAGDAPAFAGGQYWWGGRPTEKQTVFYAYSDRPAYRPKETIQFKVIAREYDGWNYSMPERQKYLARITDPQGNQVFEQTMDVNEYGSFAGEMKLGEEPPLGMYNLQFLDPQTKGQLGMAPLARVEEYKLPEFKVEISSKEAAYRLGDEMKVSIQADYYFGGPVADAEVTVVVHERPFTYSYWWPRPYPWFWEESGGIIPPWRRAPEKTVKEDKLKTDAQGKATLTIPTPKDSKTDLAYRIEVRVVDQSRREIRGEKELKVTKKEYFATLHPAHCVYRPNDKVEVDVKTKNANDEPVARQAEMRISQLEWTDKPFELEGKQVDKGYKPTLLSTQPIATNDQGEAKFAWSPNKPGYYEFEWAGKDKYGETVSGKTRIWVAAPGDHDIGYRYGGIQIVVDRESYQKGDTARLLLTSFLPHGFVLLTVEAEDVYSAQVVEMDGPVQSIEIPIDRQHEPNCWASAVMNFSFRAFFDSQEIIVPPAENYIQVEVKTDKEVYRPGEKGKATVKTVDWKGKPISAEVSLGVVDSAVYYIQSELAEDIRKFFYGEKRGQQIQTQTSLQGFPFAKFAKNDKGEIVTVNLYEIPGLEEGEKELAGREFEGARDKMNFFSYGAQVAGRTMMARAAGRMEMAAAPMAAPALGAPMGAMKAKGAAMPEAAGEAGAPLVEAQVRTDFRSTVFWQPSIVTDADGQATVEITYPDSLTEWKATARAVDKETRVGWESAETRTKKDVIVRLQAPRFFVEGDEAVISANVHNYTSEDQVAVVTLDLKGLELVKAESSTSSTPSTVSTVSTEPVPAAALKIEIGVAKDGERRVDWRCKVGKKGEATIRATAQTTVDSDAMEKKYPILEHGIEKFIAESGKLGGGAEAKGAASNTVFQMTLPAERKPEADSLVVQLSPSLAATMVGALDYLADYPYGCVEQTLSRFVPTVITAGTLRQLGLSNPELEKKIPDMVKAGLDRLRDFQHGDGGWAWWKEGDSDPYMTAYVVYGLTLAKEAGVDVPQPMLDGGIRCLNDLIIKCERQPDMLAWCLHALSYSKQLGDTARKMLDVAWVRRGELNPYTRALLLITFHNLGDKEKESILVENMENGVVFDEQTGTAHWGKSGVFYRWSDGGIEATAFAIKALLAADPQNPRIDQAMLWMVKNRRAARWTNTKDTAIAVYALADYIRVRGEAKPEYDAKVIVNGKEAATFHVDPDNVFKTDGKIEVPASMLQSGKNEIRIEKTGAGALYYSAYLTYYTLEDPIKAAGSEIFVDREYYKLTDKPTVAGEVKTEREKIEPGAPVNSGDRIEVVLNVDAKNDYEYLVFEDYKAAGLEPVDIKSGYEFKDGMSVYREFRDERTALFVSSMKQGKHKLTYTLRAEVPGHFSALPALAHAMYIPEIRANADEFKFEVGEKKAE